MNSKPKRILLRISSLLMLLAALPMLLWCWGFINSAALDRDYDYAGVGCFVAGIAYVFSMVTAIAGLAFAGAQPFISLVPDACLYSTVVGCAADCFASHSLCRAHAAAAFLVDYSVFVRSGLAL